MTEPLGMHPPESVAAILVDESPVALLSLDLHGLVLSWNRAAESLFGFAASEAVGQKLENLIVTPDMRHEIRERLLEVRRAGTLAFDSVRQRKDRAVVHVHVTMRYVPGPGGDGIVVGTARDITEVTRLRRAQASEARFRALLEAAPDAFVIVDQYGSIVIVNAQTEKIFGYDRADLIGQRADMLVPERMRVRDQMLGAEFFPTLHRRAQEAGFELVGLRRDGTEFPIEVSSSALESQREPLMSSAIRNVSDRRKAEDRFRELLEAAPDAMVIVDKDGRIVLINAQAITLFGYQREELVGQVVETLMPHRYRDGHVHVRRAYFGAPRPRAMGSGLELFGLRKDGAEFPIEISLSPLSTGGGTLVSSAIRDISARKQLERRMVEANRLKSEFLANMSHELRTPLNAIIGFADLMHKGKVGPVSPDHREYLGDILNSSKHLLQLINDVLDLAKVEAGKMDVRVERVDLGRVVSEVRDVLRGLASAKQLEIDAVIDRDTSSVVADPGRLKQILYNYLSNAIKFTPAGGQIHIRVGPESGALFRLEVEDTGVGIASEHLNRLFIEFQQLDSGSAKAYPGTGLGLALTKRLVEALGGRVEVRSAVGEGSTFAAVLPRVMSSGQAEPWPRPTIPVVRPTPRIPLNRTVLIVEDDAAAARMAETTLRQHGFEPMTRSNGFEALHAAVMNMPAFIVVDLLMPGVDGFELIARLRQSPGGRLLPIIVWTVKDLTREERQLLQGAGATIVAKGEGGAEPLVEELQRLQREGAGG